MAKSWECPTCLGDGWVDYRKLTCPTCAGIGRVHERPMTKAERDAEREKQRMERWIDRRRPLPTTCGCGGNLQHTGRYGGEKNLPIYACVLCGEEREIERKQP